MMLFCVSFLLNAKYIVLCIVSFLINKAVIVWKQMHNKFETDDPERKRMYSRYFSFPVLFNSCNKKFHKNGKCER